MFDVRFVHDLFMVVAKFSCFANIVLGVCSIVCVLSLDPFFSCVFRLNVDDVNVIFLSIFSTSQTAT